MPMISYAQNREDVLLRRVFPRPVGFYIDVGAADPVEHSVTKWFYDQGWSGINIDPLPENYRRLAAERPRDINLNVAAADRSGEVSFYEVPASMWWSTVDAGTSVKYREDGMAVTPRSVHAVTLAEVCERYARGPIDFLKIDVEGAEPAVLAGADFTRWRPVVVVVEATEVGRPTPNHDQWEPLVLSNGYEFAATDGLNRYYVRSESRELAALLVLPVNVFDDYILAEVAREQAEARHARTELAAVRGDLEAVRRALDARGAEVEGLRRAQAEGRAAYELAVRLLGQTRDHLDVMRSETLRFAG